MVKGTEEGCRRHYQYYNKNMAFFPIGGSFRGRDDYGAEPNEETNNLHDKEELFTKKEVQAYIGGRWMEYLLLKDTDTMEYLLLKDVDITIEEWFETLCRTFPRMKFRLVECKIKVIKESN